MPACTLLLRLWLNFTNTLNTSLYKNSMAICCWWHPQRDWNFKLYICCVFIRFEISFRRTPDCAAWTSTTCMACGAEYANYPCCCTRLGICTRTSEGQEENSNTTETSRRAEVPEYVRELINNMQEMGDFLDLDNVIEASLQVPFSIFMVDHPFFEKQ